MNLLSCFLFSISVGALFETLDGSDLIFSRRAAIALDVSTKNSTEFVLYALRIHREPSGCMWQGKRKASMN